MSILTNLIFLFLVSVIGFVLPWWSLFILCFIWSYLSLSRTRHIMAIVFVSHAVLISVFGIHLLRVIHFVVVANNIVTRSIFVVLVAFVFATVCGLVSSCARDIKKLQLTR